MEEYLCPQCNNKLDILSRTLVYDDIERHHMDCNHCDYEDYWHIPKDTLLETKPIILCTETLLKLYALEKYDLMLKPEELDIIKTHVKESAEAQIKHIVDDKLNRIYLKKMGAMQNV